MFLLEKFLRITALCSFTQCLFCFWFHHKGRFCSQGKKRWWEGTGLSPRQGHTEPRLKYYTQKKHLLKLKYNKGIFTQISAEGINDYQTALQEKMKFIRGTENYTKYYRSSGKNTKRAKMWVIRSAYELDKEMMSCDASHVNIYNMEHEEWNAYPHQ